jgi:hypothetical protein
MADDDFPEEFWVVLRPDKDHTTLDSIHQRVNQQQLSQLKGVVLQKNADPIASFHYAKQVFYSWQLTGAIIDITDALYNRIRSSGVDNLLEIGKRILQPDHQALVKLQEVWDHLKEARKHRDIS